MDAYGLDSIDEFLFDLRILLKNIPVYIHREDRGYGEMLVAALSDHLLEKDTLAYYAEHIRMKHHSTKEINMMREKIKEWEEGYGIPLEGNVKLDFFLSKLQGEMAFQDVFPRQAPNWHIHYLDSGAKKL